jgi:Uma2 family endonuclease
VSTLPKTFLTPEQYLEIERKAEFKSEYHNGEMFAMAGASFAHGLLIRNVMRELDRQLLDRPCRPIPNDLRVFVPATGLFTYPDVVVSCGEPRFLDSYVDTLINPTVLVEVLSPSTEAYDRGRKFEHYRSITTLQEYLLVASDRVHVDLYTRQPDSRWLLTSASQEEESISLSSLGCVLTLNELYRDFDLGRQARAEAR